MKDKIIISFIMSMVLAFTVITTPAVSAKEAAKAYYVQVEGTVNMQYAYKVLELINKYREDHGCDAIIMNEFLLDSAVQRAAELSVSFDHTRPDGSSCFTSCDLMYAENIAAGQLTPKEVVKAWKKSKPHRANILKKGYQSCGIGCFKNNGVYYWVQDFGISNADEFIDEENRTQRFSIKVKNKLKYKLSVGKKLTMKEGATKKINIFRVSSDNAYFNSKLLSASGKWKSSNKKVATINRYGKLTAKKKGTATITCTMGGVEKSFKVTVKKADQKK